MANEIVPQSIDGYLEQLNDEDPRLRYEAICYFARSVFIERYWEVYNAVWKHTEDAHPRVSSAAGIAASMITARHFHLLHKSYPSITGGVTPDYLPEWGE